MKKFFQNILIASSVNAICPINQMHEKMVFGRTGSDRCSKRYLDVCSGQIPTDGICSRSEQKGTCYCSQLGGSLFSPKDAEDELFLRENLGSSGWIGVEFTNEAWRFSDEKDEVPEEKDEMWVYGRPPTLRKKFRRIGEKSENFNRVQDRTCVKWENGLWREQDCLMQEQFICKLPDIDCDDVDTDIGFYTRKDIDFCGEAGECVLSESFPFYSCVERTTEEMTTPTTFTSTFTSTTMTSTSSTTMSSTITTSSTSTVTTSRAEINDSGEHKLGEKKCPDCFLENDDGSCFPNFYLIELTCSPHQIGLRAPKCLFTNQEAPKISSCASAEADEDGDTFSFAFKLDGCETQVASEGNDLVFSNKLRAEGRRNGFIQIAPNFEHSFECKFPRFVDDIHAKTTVHDPDFDAGANGEGELEFSLTTYQDEKFTEEATENDVVAIGDRVFVGLEMIDPISTLDFKITNCTVSDTALGLQFNVIENTCPDSFVKTEIFRERQEKINFSYTSFQFRAQEDDLTTQQLSCSVEVCAGECSKGPGC
ncbi:Oidioi.mRNA.OKI2018_I69.chr1.g949.t1.cds [Oikopleura dioica]|uniref:Oidioi.mRNA.OKI2018_I69.chr1.g949.t1.cds n=1 Tax=Oikopleura dioica TaxID=34765 RepID=A0ABN7SLG7_OIKDI|nr:Oidioi.mRNA.OKI2018_I69.chr1.g949.t1.cds [Oikopleura dioica]